MTDQLSAKDWLDQGLKTLAKSGFTALKAEPLAKAAPPVAAPQLQTDMRPGCVVFQFPSQVRPPDCWQTPGHLP